MSSLDKQLLMAALDEDGKLDDVKLLDEYSFASIIPKSFSGVTIYVGIDLVTYSQMLA
jgi:hypothetical protein